MKRNVDKSIKEYYSLEEKGSYKPGYKFYASEIQQIHDLAVSKGNGHFPAVLWESISSSLAHGFMVGYRQGLRDAARQQANKKGVSA